MPVTGGFTFGGLGSTPTFGFGATAFTTTTTASTGFSLGTPSTAGSATTSGGLNFTLTVTTAPSLFSTALTTPSTGLGGVDPKASTTLSGSGSTNGKASDVKMVKATPLDGLIVATVDHFKKFVKDEKTVREEITRLSCKDLVKVEEDVTALRQLLTTLSAGVHRNASAVDKLKWEMTQELKNAEMAHRTKDIPGGLQYENTAPTIYFQRLSEKFDSQIQTYQRQIEMMESHLSSLHHRTMTPQELASLLRKLHDTFIALAAQLHQVHESVKSLKERYLTYRRVVHGDSRNVFDKTPKTSAATATMSSKPVDRLGPSPFSGLSSSTAYALSSALTRPQQTTGVPPAVGLNQPSTLGGGLFGSSMFTGTGTQPTSSIGGSLFGNTSFGTGNFNNSNLAFGFGSQNSAPAIGTSLFGETKPFQLQKPPQGAKRGKR